MRPDAQEIVARAIRKNRFERNGTMIRAYDETIPPNAGELADAAAAIAALRQDADLVVGLRAQIVLLDKLLSQRFARSAPIEEQLMHAAFGKRPLPTAEECRQWALKLGKPAQEQTA